MRKSSSVFVELVSRLKAAYQPWESGHIVLCQLESSDSVAKIADLGQLLKTAFFKAHADKGFDPTDPQYSPQTFCGAAQQALIALQTRLKQLSDQRGNAKGYMLLESDGEIRWFAGMAQLVEMCTE